MVKAPRHILAAISDEPSALHGVRFISRFLRVTDDIAVTLLFVVPKPPDVENPGRFLTSSLARGKFSLDQAARLLVEAGFPSESVEQKNLFARRSKPAELAAEAVRGLYDAVVLGRRGHAWLMDLVEGSVSSDIVDTGLRVPVWIARMPGEDRTGVLACLDDSEQAFGMVDHVGFLLARESQPITLFSVLDPGHEDHARADALFKRAVGMLEQHGVGVERIHTKTVASANPAKAILAEAADGHYAAIGVGRTGENKGTLFMGSVSTTLLKELTGAALLVHQ